MSYRITDEKTGQHVCRDDRGGVDDYLDMIDPEHEDRWRYSISRHY